MLLDAINDVREQFGEAPVAPPVPNHRPSVILTRDDLRLICFDLISG
ncbi:MAG: hypothetical protein JOZ29_06860 [Deltaproteobacteria bacterium]|nr:hypothetical protein [Deltaproteobacteria bacterium]